MPRSAEVPSPTFTPTFSYLTSAFLAPGKEPGTVFPAADTTWNKFLIPVNRNCNVKMGSAEAKTMRKKPFIMGN
jgi:hypothetical protein